MSKFKEKYSLPDATPIQLEDVTFHVILPTSANRRFERAIAASMSERDPVTGGFRVKEFSINDVFSAQHKAFLSSCVISVDGLEFEPVEFYNQYPDAAEELYSKAVELAQSQEAGAAEEAGKSLPSSPGEKSGKEGRISMKNLNQKAG